LAVALSMLALANAPAPAPAYESIQLKKTILLADSPKTFTPAGVAVDAGGRLWVTNSATNELLLFSADGTLLQRLGHKGRAPGQWDSPRGVAVDADGQVYVADSGNARIQWYSADGKLLGTFGQKGGDPGQFQEPWLVAVSQDGVVIVGERDRSRLQLFSRDGVYLRSFDTESPVDGLAVDIAGMVYVAHAKARLVEKWSTVGQMMKSFSGIEPGVKGFTEPGDLAVNAMGLLYVGDSGARQFREMDPGGHTQGAFGRSGSGDGQFKTLSGLAIVDDTLYVGDARNHRIVVWTLSRSNALPILRPAPASRIQVSRHPAVALDADRLTFSADGLLHALSFLRSDITSFDADGKSLGVLDLKKTLGVKAPAGLTTAPSSGSFFISDAGNNRVVKSDRAGKLLLEFGKSEHLFKGTQGELSNPQGLACSPQGVLFVADTGNSRLQAFNHQGLFQFAAGEKGSGPGQLKTPTSIAWDKESIDVADPANRKIVTFNLSGRFLHEFGSVGPEALLDPRQIALDREGNLFVLDGGRGRVLAYDPQGMFLGAFGSAGRQDGFLFHPRSLAINDNNDLVVAEEGRIQRFHIVVLPPAPNGLTATPGEGYIALRWNTVPARFPVRYAVYRSSGTGAPERLKETVDTTYTDDSLTPGTTMTYTVVAQTAQGATSVPSAAVQAMAQDVTGPRLEIVSAQIDDIFSAHYKYYGRVPAGHVIVRNNGIGPVLKLKVSFAIQGYMDYPSETSIPALHSGEEKDVALLPTFNNRILEVTETTPIQAQITLSFTTGDKENTVVRRLPFKLYSRNTIRWDNKGRLAAFITPNDPPIIDFARGAATPFADVHKGAPVPAPLMSAWTVFEGLGTYGISYVPRPNNPYDRVSLDSNTVDTVQFARETLARKSGDCADVVVLLASALESLTVTTAALDAPGHMFLMFDTGETQKDLLGFPDDMVVNYAGSYWIPIEATMLGSPFLEAWKKGAEEYWRWSQKGQLAPIDIHESWRTFEPATLPEMASGPKAPPRDAIEEKFLTDWKALANLRWQTGVEAANQAAQSAPQSGVPWLRLGFLAVDFHRYEEAKEYFSKARQDPATAASAFNNLGNLAFLRGDYDSADALYQDSQQLDSADPEVSLNLARVYLKKKQRTKALAVYNHAMGLDPSLREQYPDISALMP